MQSWIVNSDPFVYIAYVPVGIAALWCTLNFGRLRSEFRVLAFFIFLSAVTQGTSEVLAEFRTNNLPLSHLYVVLSTLILLEFYRQLLRKFVPANWFRITGGLFLLFAIVNAWRWEPLLSFNTNTLTAQAVAVIILTLSTFILTLNEAFNHHLLPIQKGLNWINSGLFIYFSGSLLLFYNGDAIMHAISVYWTEYTWLAHAALSVVLHICLLIGLWVSPKK